MSIMVKLYVQVYHCKLVVLIGYFLGHFSTLKCLFDVTKVTIQYVYTIPRRTYLNPPYPTQAYLPEVSNTLAEFPNDILTKASPVHFIYWIRLNAMDGVSVTFIFCIRNSGWFPGNKRHTDFLRQIYVRHGKHVT